VKRRETPGAGELARGVGGLGSRARGPCEPALAQDRHVTGAISAHDARCADVRRASRGCAARGLQRRTKRAAVHVHGAATSRPGIRRTGYCLPQPPRLGPPKLSGTRSCPSPPRIRAEPGGVSIQMIDRRHDQERAGLVRRCPRSPARLERAKKFGYGSPPPRCLGHRFRARPRRDPVPEGSTDLSPALDVVSPPGGRAGHPAQITRVSRPSPSGHQGASARRRRVVDEAFATLRSVASCLVSKIERSVPCWLGGTGVGGEDSPRGDQVVSAGIAWS